MEEYKVASLDNEEEIIQAINSIDKQANEYLLKIGDLYREDLYFMSVIDKSIKLIDSFLFALEQRNITVLAILSRVQMDCAMRAFATSLVTDSSDFCKAVLYEGKRINRLKSLDGKNMSDKYLCEKLGEFLKIPAYEIYEKVCDYVHFSPASFHNIASLNENGVVAMFISRKNRTEYEQEYQRISFELANIFIFFGKVLVVDIFSAWLEQKK